jgi:polyhydroxybutyrate depolymerase
VLLLSLLVGACGPQPAPAAAPTVCQAAATPRSSTTITIDAGGRDRTVVVHIPPGYSGTAPMPLVLNLHGAGSTALEQEAFSGMDATADGDGFIVAYPEALIPARGTTTQARGGAGGFRWNVVGDAGVNPPDAADDVAYIKQTLAELQRRYCIDAARIYATGMSNGSIMSSQLACELSGSIAAIAPVSGLRLPEPCHATRPVSILTFHGTADPLLHYDGGGFWTYGAVEAARRWAAKNGCEPNARISEPAARAALMAFTCPKGTAVELYTIAGAGHTWPGGPPLDAVVTNVLGAGSTAIDANAVMWRFFSEHPLR